MSNLNALLLDSDPVQGQGTDSPGRKRAKSENDIREALPGFLFADTETLNHMVEDTRGDDLHGANFLEPGSMPAAVYTLSSISLGVGVFVLPIVIKDMGLLTGLACLVAFGWWANMTQVWLVDCAASFEPPIRSYEDLASAAFGKLGKFLLAFFTAFTMLVGNAAHMQTVVQILHDLLEWYATGEYGKLKFSHEKELTLYIGLLAVALVFCTGRNMSSLRYVSTASVSVVLMLCVWCTGECLFWYWPKGTHAFSGDRAATLASSDWRTYAASLPAIAFTYSGTFCLFPVYHELVNPTRARINKAINLSTAVCCTGYVVVSLVGVLTFGKHINYDPFKEHTTTNYLYVFPPNHYVVTLLCFFLVIVITLLYPVINFPMINAVEKMLSLVPLPAMSKFLHWSHHRLLLTVVGMVIVVLLNLQLDSLVALFGLCGGWGVGFVVYIIPSAIYVRLSTRSSLAMRAFAVVSALAMLVIAVAFTYVTFF